MKGYIYILTNDSLQDSWVKILKSKSELRNTSTDLHELAFPGSFSIYASLKTQWFVEAEILFDREFERQGMEKSSEYEGFYHTSKENAAFVLNEIAIKVGDGEVVINAKAKHSRQSRRVTSNRTTSRTSSSKSNAWYFPCNPLLYRIHDCVNELGYAY